MKAPPSSPHPPAASATISGLATCSTHTYTVTAYNSAGESAASGGVTVTTTGCVTAPPTPGGLSVTGTTGTVDLARLVRGGRRDRLPRLRGHHAEIPGRPATTATISGLAACATHSYTVTAYNANGESAKSGAVSGTTTGCTNPGLPKHALIGYLHASFANGSGYIKMADVPAAWDIIDLAFGEPTSVTSGNIQFNRCAR